MKRTARRPILDRVNQPGFAQQDQWQAQVQAQILLKAEVYVHSTYLSDDQLVKGYAHPSPFAGETLQNLVERTARCTDLHLTGRAGDDPVCQGV